MICIHVTRAENRKLKIVTNSSHSDLSINLLFSNRQKSYIIIAILI